MIKVLKSGFYSTIQDLGRFGYRDYGVPISGAMDLYASEFANALLGNSKECAVLEMTMVGPTLQFLKPTRIVVSGATMNPILNDKTLAMNTVIAVKTNDVLSFGKLEKGLRSYLAIKGGFLTEQVLGSRSMIVNITQLTNLALNDTLDYLDHTEVFESSNANVKYNDAILETSSIIAYKGPEYDKLTKTQKNRLLATDFKVSKLNNRMAYQLEPLIENNLESILTAPVLPGTVQLTPSGRLITLMRDCQTTGGYPRILQLTNQALNCLSQKREGNNIKISLKG